MTTAVVVGGGWAHPAEASVPAVVELLTGVGVVCEVVDDVDAAAQAVVSRRPDLLCVMACRFTMSDDRYTAEQRAEWSYRTSPSVRAAFTDHVRHGGALLGLHTASICFDDWIGWAELLGGQWDWSRSNHPEVGAMEVEPVVGHLVTAGLERFTVVDERYRFLALGPQSEVVAHATDDDGTHPIAWVVPPSVGGSRGRVAYSALGHDRRSLGDPAHRAFLGRVTNWLIGGDAPWPT